MNARFNSYTRPCVAALSLVFGYAVYAGGPRVLAETSPVPEARHALRLELQDAHGVQIAAAGARSWPHSKKSVQLVVDHKYQPGDRIVVTGPQRIALKLDGNIPECLIYAPAGKLTYDIPYGRAEAATGSAYSPDSFAGRSHRLAARATDKRALAEYRNLALNPCDLPRPDPVEFYPHASSNSVSRSLFDFEARNAIDGVAQNGHHGVWPYQSWGPQLRTDIWWKIDFGRAVELDKIRLMVRADFPHDSYWKSVDVEFSDGTRQSISLQGSADFQDFSFPARRVSWFRIVNPVPTDPAKWCSFIEVEAWGRDLR